MLLKTLIQKHILNYSTVLLLAFLVRLVWIFLIPQLSNAPDEVSHWIAVKYLSDYFRQPSSKEIVSLQAGAHLLQVQMSYFHMVVAKYLLSQLFTTEKTLVYAARISNALLSIVVVLNCKFFFKKSFGDNHFANLLSLAFAFHPQYVFISSYINNDIFACWLVTLSIIAVSNFLVKPALRDELADTGFWQKLNQLSPLLLSLSLFCSLYAKSSALLVYIATATVVTIIAVQRIINNLLQRDIKNLDFSLKISKKIIIRLIVFILASLLLGYLFYFLYALKLSLPGISPSDIFSGSFMAQTIVYPNLPKGIYNNIFSSHSFISYLQIITKMGYWQIVLDGFWGIFDNMSIRMSPLWYYFYMPYLIIFFWGALQVFARSSKSSLFLVLDYALFLVVILMCIGSLSFSYKVDLQPQGRHFLPILVVFYYFLLKGIQSFAGYYSTRFLLLLLLATSIICTTLYVPLNLFQGYYN